MSGFTEKEVGLGKMVSSIKGVGGLETGDLRYGGKEGAGAKPPVDGRLSEPVRQRLLCTDLLIL